MRKYECPLPQLVPEHGIVDVACAKELMELDAVARSTAAWVEARKGACEAECAEARADAVAEGFREGFETFCRAVEAFKVARERLATELDDILARCLSETLGACPDRDIMRACISSVLDNGYEDGDLVIQVAPDGFNALEEAVSSLNLTDTLKPRISIEVSEALQSGRCVFFAPTDVLTVDRDILTTQLLAALSVPEVVDPLRARLAEPSDVEVVS